MPGCLPAGYKCDTSCCIRCGKVVDRSHPDSYELYCGSDGVKEPSYFFSSDDLNNHEEYHRKAMAWHEWAVPRHVEPWATCPLFVPKKFDQEDNPGA